MTAIPDNAIIKKDSAQIIVGITKGGVKEAWNKSLSLITPPKTTGQQDINEGSNVTKIVDILNKAERRLTFTGNIGGHYTRSADRSKNTSGVQITDGTDELDTMRQIFFGGGTFTIDWNGNELTVNCDKFTADWEPNDRDTITSYSVLFTVVVGENL